MPRKWSEQYVLQNFKRGLGTLGLPHSVIGKWVRLVIVMKIVIKNSNNKILTLLEELCKVHDIPDHAPARPPVTRSVTHQGPQLLSFCIHHGGRTNHQNGWLSWRLSTGGIRRQAGLLWGLTVASDTPSVLLRPSRLYGNQGHVYPAILLEPDLHHGQ